MKKTDVCIVGGGPAGMMTAIVIAEKLKDMNYEITIIEHKDKPGKKLLATGNGRCNFANDIIDDMSFRGENASFAYNIIKQFDLEKMLGFMRQIGVLHTSLNGYYYPRSLQAGTVCEALKIKLSSLKVNICCNVNVTGIVKDGKGYVVKTDSEDIAAGYVVVATGGKSYKNLGSDGSGYRFAKKLGHRVTKLYPALVGLAANGLDFKMCSGVRAKGKISLLVKDNVICSSEGEIQFADYGISGIPVFQISRYASDNIGKGNKVQAVIDFVPEYDILDIKEIIREILGSNKKQTILGALNAFIPLKLAKAILKRQRVDVNAGVRQIDNGVLISVASELKGLKIGIENDCGFEKAQVTAGGVDTSEISEKTLESKINKGLYFAGEVLDVDGNCGGYNLHFAFACGYVIGKAIVKEEKGQDI